MKNIKIILLLSIFITAIGCQDIKSGLTGQKKSNSDEFLVKKKNKLVVPPDFEKLPKPRTSVEEKNNENLDEDIKKLITKQSKKSKSKTVVKKKSKIESSILEKINAK